MRQHAGQQRGALHRHAPAGGGRAAFPGHGRRGGGDRRAAPASSSRWCRGPAFDPNMLTGRVTPAQMAALTKDPLQPMIFRAGAAALQPGLDLQGRDRARGAASRARFTPAHARSTAAAATGSARAIWRCHKDTGHGPVDAQPRAAAVLRHLVLQGGRHARAGPHRRRWARRFGLGAPTGIGVVAEVPGHHAGQRLPRPGHPRRLHQGHGAQQRHRPGRRQRDAAAAGDGRTRRSPTAARSTSRSWCAGIETPDGADASRSSSPRSCASWTSTPSTARLVVDALTAVVNEPGGTAYRSAAPGHARSPGKTGTAQVVAHRHGAPEEGADGLLAARPRLVRLVRAGGGSGDRGGGAQRARRPRRRRTRRPPPWRSSRSTSS